MSKPKILLSAKLNPQNYANALEAAGGIAVMATEHTESIDSYDGLILCGGSDIHPKYYNEEIDSAVNIDDERDAKEFALIRGFAEAKKPIFGICRGCQLINVYFGGSLYQHLSNASGHSSGASYDIIHEVEAEDGSIAKSLYGSTFTANSSHHQAAKVIGKGLKVTMTADDGTVIEGLEHTELPIIATQWHPERMCCDKRREDTVDGIKIFEYFVRLCISQKRCGKSL